MSTVGQRLRYVRDFRELTSEQLDQVAGIPPGTAMRVESAARLGTREAEHIPKLASALAVRSAWLQRGDSGGATPRSLEESLQRIPHQLLDIYGRPAVWLAGPEMFPENVVRTSQYPREMSLLVAELHQRSSAGRAYFPAWLVPEPNNPHDQFAVGVVIGELRTGHLPHDAATGWQPLILALQARYNRYAACKAEVSQFDDPDGGPMTCRVELLLPLSMPKTSILSLGTPAELGDAAGASPAMVVRGGIARPVDAVFNAWTSGDLQRMLDALDTPTNRIDRHFLLLGIVERAYKDRKAALEMRQLATRIGLLHIAEFENLAPALREEFKDAKGRPALPRVPTFQYVTTLLSEDGRIGDAIAVCEAALRHGLHDGTKGGFEKRIERLRKQGAAGGT